MRERERVLRHVISSCRVTDGWVLACDLVFCFGPFGLTGRGALGVALPACVDMYVQFSHALEGLRASHPVTLDVDVVSDIDNDIDIDVDIDIDTIPRNVRLTATLRRHYGALQGRNKATLEEAMGEVVVEWRRAYGVRPPPMTDTHPHWPLISLDSRYRGLKIPESESLRDTANRVSLFFIFALLSVLCCCHMLLV